MSDAATNPPSPPPKRRFDWKFALIIAVAAITVGGVIVAFVLYPEQAAEEAIGKPTDRIAENFEGPGDFESIPEGGSQ